MKVCFSGRPWYSPIFGSGFGKGIVMVKKRGLGKTLDALLIGSLATTEEDDHSQEKLCSLSVDLFQRGKYQPRRDMDPEALQELSDSIRAQGVIQPIIARNIAGGRYEIVAGERRWRAAQMAGLTHIPVIVRNIPDEAAVAIALIENIQREDLNPIEEAIALQRLLEEFSMTHQQVADAVGKSRTGVTNLLRLLTLANEVKTMLEHGDIEMGHARALLTLTEIQQVETAQRIADKNLTVRETEEMVRRLQSPKLPDMPRHIDPDVKRLQDELANLSRLKVSIQYNAKGKGKVVFRYKNLNELDKLLEFFQ